MTRTSFSKNNIKVLLLENIHDNAKKIFEDEGYQVESLKHGFNEDELAEKIKDVSILGIRSKTKVTKKVIDNANNLLAIGTFCIGTDQVDLRAAQEKGIVTFNAPFSNTRSVVELAFGEIIMLIRQTFEKSSKMHKGVWDKSAAGSFEIRGKKLGIVGYGNIGFQLSVLAESFGMKVYYYDVAEKMPLGNAKKCKNLTELLNKSDIVTIHVDGRKSNENLINEDSFKAMKDGVIFLNLSRGKVVDINALVDNIKSGKVAGAGIDVFPHEPSNGEEFESKLRGLKNVILTPHVGGSTEEAQMRIAEYVPNKVLEFMNSGITEGSVNFPNIVLPKVYNSHRLIHAHKNMPGMLSQINLIFTNHNINVQSQYLKTDENIGYVITDIDTSYNKEIVEELKNIEGTIKFRILY